MSADRPVAPRHLLTARDVAFRLNISLRTVYRWVDAGRLPPPVRYPTRIVRWRAQDLDAFAAAPRPTAP